MAAMRDRLDAPVLVGVGAAFDFHAGLVPQAPALDAAPGPGVGVPARRRSRAACGGATCATTRASSPGSLRQCAGAPRAHRPLDSALSRRRGHRTAAASGCRSRWPSPTAACACSASTTTPSAWPPCAERRMPFEEPGAEEVLRARRHRTWSRRAPPTPRRPTPSSSRSARRRSRTSRSTCATSARSSTTCCPSCAPATCSCCARPSRRGRPSSSPATSRSTAASRSASDVFVAHVARAHRRRALLRGDRHAAVHRRRRRRGLGRARRARCSSRSGRRSCRRRPVEAELAKIWTNILRYAMFALPNLPDDGVRAVRRERLRGHRPHQPRLSPRRDAAAGLHRGDVPAQGLHLLRGALPAPGMLLAVSRVHESVPLFLVEGLKRRLGSLRGRKVAVLGLAFKADTDDERDSLAHKLIRLLERELADVAVHDPARRDADAVLRGRGPRRRRGGHRDQPQRVPRPPGAGARSPTAPRATRCWPIRGTASTPSRSSAGRPSWSPHTHR